MEMDDFFLATKGYFDKRKRDELNFANVAAIIDGFAAGLSGNKGWRYSKFIAGWFGEKSPELSKEERKARSKEMMDRVRLTNKIIEEKEKLTRSKKKFNGRSAKNNN